LSLYIFIIENMGAFRDFFISKKSPSGGQIVSKYHEYDQTGRLGMEKKLRNVEYRDRVKMREMFKKHGSFDHERKSTNNQIYKMMKAELGDSGYKFRQRIKAKVLSTHETLPTGPTEEQKHNRALAFRYDRAAEEAAKGRKGPQFANAFNYKQQTKQAAGNLPGVSANPAGIRSNNAADRVQHSMNDNPHLGL
jgi:hypothetical protein